MRDGAYTSLAHYHGKLVEQLSLRRLHGLQTWLAGQFGPGADPLEIMQGIGARLAEAEPQADASDHALPAVCDVIIKEIDDRNAGLEPRVLRTPIEVWDDAFGGLPAGAYLGLGGRPGSGKSSLMEQIIFHLIQDEIPVLLFEKDMSLKMLVLRLACRACGVPYWKISKDRASRTERDIVRETVAFFPKTKLRLQNPANLSADKFAAIVRREKRLHGIQAVFLDQIHHLDIGKADTVDGLTRASMRVKASAHENDIPHVVLFAVNRNAPQGTRPKPEHVKGFDQLLSDVDGMAMLWTEEDKTKLPKGQKLKMFFYAAKNRAGAETEEPTWFDGPMLTFCNGEHDSAHLRPPEPATRPVTESDFQ